MGAPIAIRLAESGHQVSVAARSAARLESALNAHSSVSRTTDLGEAVSGAGLVIVAVPPAATEPTIAKIAPSLAPGALVATLSPHTSLVRLGELLPRGVYAARLMPNTALRLGASMTFISFAADVPADVQTMLIENMTVMGQVTVIAEHLMPIRLQQPPW